MMYSSFFLVFLMASSTASLAGVVQVRSGEHTNFTRVALRIPDPVKYKFQISEGNIKVNFTGDDIHLDVGSAMDRLSSGRVRFIEFNKESISLNIETTSEARVTPAFESPYLYFDVYDVLPNYSSDDGGDFSGPLMISDANQFSLLPASRELMKSYFHTGRSWSLWRQFKSKLDLPLLIGMDEISSTSNRVPDFYCYNVGKYQMEENSRDFIVDLRSSRRQKSLEGSSEIYHRWNLFEEENSLTGRKQGITEPHPSRRYVSSGGMIVDSERCKDAEIYDFSLSPLEAEEIGAGTPQKGLSQTGSDNLASSEARGKYFNEGFEEVEGGEPIHDLDAYKESAFISLDANMSSDALNREFLSISFMGDEFVRNFYESILANDDDTLIYRYFSISQISRLSPEVLSKLKNKIRGDGYSWLSAEIIDRYNYLDNGRNK